MYDPPKFLTEDVLAHVLDEFPWPAPYALEDDLPDGIIVRLPACELYVSESFESSMIVKFRAESTGLERSVSVTDVVLVLHQDPRYPRPPAPPLLNYNPGPASLLKVQNQLRDRFTQLFAYFPQSLLGDFRWVADYQRLLDLPCTPPST